MHTVFSVSCLLPIPPAHSWAAGTCHAMVHRFVTHLLCSWDVPQLTGMSHRLNRSYATWTLHRENPKRSQGCSTSGHIRRIPRKFCRQSHYSEFSLLLGRKNKHSSVPTSIQSHESDKYPHKNRWLCTVRNLSGKQKLRISSMFCKLGKKGHLIQL